jgi:short-subunit dehydrogenase
LRSFGIRITTVNPGFIVSAMTEKNKFKMPFLMKADRAARIIVDGIERGKRIVEFPFPMSMAMRFARIIPAWMFDRVMGGYAKARR